MGGPSNFFVVPTVELLAVEVVRISTGLTNPTAENQRVDELKLECTKCWAEPDFFDFRILARMKAPSAMMLSPEFFVERLTFTPDEQVVKWQFDNCRESSAKTKKAFSNQPSAFSDGEQGWL